MLQAVLDSQVGEHRGEEKLVSALGGKRSLATAKEEHPSQRHVGEHLKRQKRFREVTALCPACGTISGLNAITDGRESEQRRGNYDVAERPPAKGDDLLAVHVPEPAPSP